MRKDSEPVFSFVSFVSLTSVVKMTDATRPLTPSPLPPPALTPAPLPGGEGRLEIPFSPWEKGMG